MGSTAVGNGIAIPHARHPVVLPVDKPLLNLCFLAEPVDFGAASGERVHTLFVLVSPTVPAHLQMLARVAFLLHNKQFSQALATRTPPGKILLEARRAEMEFEHDSQGHHPER